MLRRMAFLTAFIVFSCSPAFALPDIKGSRDHSLFRRPAGYAIISYSQRSDAVTIPVKNELVSLSGKQTDILYAAAGQPLSASVLGERFIEAVRRAGGEIVYQENPGLGGRRIAGKLVRSGRDVWVIQDAVSLRQYRLVILETPNHRGNVLPSAANSSDIYEMEAQVLDLLHELDRTGRLEIPVKFAGGSAVLQRGYETGFKKLVMLMEKDPDVSFRVETYAESSSKPAEQRILLRERSMAIVDALAALGADRKRLTTETENSEVQPSPVRQGLLRLTIASIENAAP